MQNKLKEIFTNKIRFKSATGIDRIRPEKFEEDLDKEVCEIEEKIKRKSYNFRPYKELLILKSRSKLPRLVSIPTVRDKLVLNYLLGEIAPKLEVHSEFIYSIISKLKKELDEGKFYFAKLDITGFYDNINHELLIEDLISIIDDDYLSDILIKALKNPTATMNSKPTEKINSKGVPQGIPISNILAGFFAKRIDKVCQEESDVYYTRYVDDILVLADSPKKIEILLKKLKDKIRSCGLEVNDEKEQIGHIDEGLEFLGYSFNRINNEIKIGIRDASYRKHYHKILKVCTAYKELRKKGKGNIERFKWDLNLKITGAILNKDRYGWLFFFSQIDDNSEQLYSLDLFVDTQLKKLGLRRDELKIKRFSRTLHEIRKNLKDTHYIPNFDTYTHEMKKNFLLNIAGVSKDEIDLLTEAQIDYKFHKKIYRDMSSLEEDLGSVS